MQEASQIQQTTWSKTYPMLEIVSFWRLSFIWLRAFRRIKSTERRVRVRGSRRGNVALGPGVILSPPFFGRLERVSIEPFSVSLPPQSAITQDEIPIQLQSSMEARVINPEAAVTRVRDWRIFLMSELQALLKDGIEELDFDHLDESFPEWSESIRKELNRKAGEIGVAITGMQISNLSPRSRPA
jgi:regulator of protease activity HflC (stomatin/prohibitin superfamily)